MANTDPNAAKTYFILDPEMRFVGRTRIPKGAKTIAATPQEAEFFLGTGLSETDPNAEPEPAKGEKPKGAAAKDA